MLVLIGTSLFLILGQQPLKGGKYGKVHVNERSDVGIKDHVQDAICDDNSDSYGSVATAEDVGKSLSTEELPDYSDFSQTEDQGV